MATIEVTAQSVQSTILGTVKDQGGALVVAAQVVIIDADTGRSANYASDNSGDFQAPDLSPGRYEVRVSKAGFQSKLISDLTLAARQQLRVDVTLAVGAAQQEVTVDAGTVGAIETETPSIASTLNTQSVMSLPSNYRASGSTSPLNMVQALPGVQSDNGLNFSVQGGQPFQTETSVDGISTQNVTSNTPLSDAFPSTESIAEMRVDGVSNNAEFGQAGEITTVTKGGTNQLHGSLFWYHQNRAFDAVAYGTPVDPATGKVERPEKIGNDFGASAGGPLDIPNLYSGHDKTFFFGDYEGFHFPKQSTIQDLVPTQSMLAGDFSQEIPFDPSNPSTWLFNPSNGGIYQNNVVTPVNASAQPFLSLFPAPNVSNYQTVTEAEAGLGYNYAANRDSSYQSNQFDARIDHRFSQKLQGFARYTFKNITSLAPQDLNIPSVTDFDDYRILASSLVYSFTPNLLNEFRFGFTDERNGMRNQLNGGPYTAAAGFQPVGPNYPVNGMAAIYFPNLTMVKAGNLNNTSQSHLFQYADNLTWTKGTHTTKYGFDIRTMQSITTLGSYGLNNVSVFAFTGQVTGALLANSGAAQFADYLSGAPVETQYYTLIPENDGRSIYYGGFAQDQWNVRPNLTVSYGLRYEYHPAYHDANGAIGNFDPGTPGTGSIIYPAGHQNLLDPSFLATFDGCGYGPSSTPYAQCTPVLSNSEAHLPSSLRHSQKDRLLPRFGLAWRPFNDDKTAVRAGFGVYNTTLLGSIFFAMTDSLQAATLSFQNSMTPNGLAYMWPQTSPGTGLSTPVYGSSSFNTADKIDWKDPYSMQWNVSIDRQFQGNIGTRISYIAMKTDDLVWTPDLNAMSYSSTTPTLQRPLTDRPFPNWGAINSHLPGAQANYESLQTEANHRTRSGFTFDSAYTWAKNLADNVGTGASGFQSENGGNSSQSTYLYNRKIDYGDVNGTRRHRWINTGVYELPVGRGRKFAADANRFEDAMVGGWQLSSIFLWQTGPYLTPYIPGSDADPSGTGSGILYGSDQRPDIVGKVRPAHQNRNQWVNPQAFACPSNSGYTASSYAGNACGVGVTSNPIGRFGNASIGDIEGPGTANWSAGANKRIAITERVQLRSEVTFTNVLNHTNLSDPLLDITNPNFGKITSARGSDFGGNRTGQISMRLEF
ncbi:TonB-dependent receptor [Acidobacterium sp. S8]|uniref:TonB-dependent receptor n=1 Tax=Acidobacterium sp. S8 TaxID=1641854 RepID=UPI001C2044AF|nr:TonB-dependent receptor [Acidobacterium sp. S8]